jgi:hypothetical protein
MAGRPSLYRPELGRQAEALLARGRSLRQAAAELGVSARRLRRWVAEGLVATPGVGELAPVEAEPEPEDNASALGRLHYSYTGG